MNNKDVFDLIDWSRLLRQPNAEVLFFAGTPRGGEELDR